MVVLPDLDAPIRITLIPPFVGKVKSNLLVSNGIPN
jgi:hypothetical protein